MQNNYDLIVVGAGASGLMASVTCAQNGNKVLLVDTIYNGHLIK
jgi:predicted flavoprotein YhiN